MKDRLDALAFIQFMFLENLTMYNPITAILAFPLFALIIPTLSIIAFAAPKVILQWQQDEHNSMIENFKSEKESDNDTRN